MKKLKKKPAESLIKSVIDDLNEEAAEPSIHGKSGAQKVSADSISAPDGLSSSSGSDDKTTVLSSDKSPAETPANKEEFSQISDKTYVAPKGHGHGILQRSATPENAEVKVSFGSAKPNLKANASSFDAQLAQAENLKFAQSRIIELEKDIERIRKENEMLASANEIAKQKLDDYMGKIQNLERTKTDLKEQNESELRIFKDGLVSKDAEIHRLRTKVEELESRLSADLKKIRVRERELENRLELSKLEKTALTRSKDETILELKRQIEHLSSEVDNYQHKVIELNQKIESSHEQFGRTVRALRLALTNLEVNHENTSSITIAPYKKAE